MMSLENGKITVLFEPIGNVSNGSHAEPYGGCIDWWVGGWMGGGHVRSLKME